MGFDGIDLTVRPKGHVLPERVSEDLPLAAEIFKKAGLKIYMITTSINNADDPVTTNILKTASSLGIRHYRMDWFNYEEEKSIEENLVRIRIQMEKLALLNEKYSIFGEYQNHSGTYFGASVWDLYEVLNEIRSPWLGSQFDIMHAMVEGANSWKTRLKLIKPYIHSLDMKDFIWLKEKEKWTAEPRPLGDGMINFPEYLTLLKQYEIAGPVSLHFEYPLGGAETGANSITIPKEEFLFFIQKDLKELKKKFSAAGLSS
jgi:L-ribulose-5-phosphate 3-epimerase